MGGSSPPPPAAPPPPAPPNYAAANREAVQADIDTLPKRKAIELAAKKQDLLELAPLERQNAAASSDAMAQAALAIQQKYGSAFNQQALARLQEADPTGFAARKSLAQSIYDDMALGSKLSPNQTQNLEENIRGAQAARGNILGNAPAAQEIAAKFELGQQLRQQRLSNASNYVLGTPLTAQYQNIGAAQNGAAPFNPQPMPNGMGLNPNAGALGAQFASGIYGSQMGGYGAGLGYAANIYNTHANMPNPWMQGLGMAGGAGSSLGAAALM